MEDRRSTDKYDKQTGPDDDNRPTPIWLIDPANLEKHERRETEYEGDNH